MHVRFCDPEPLTREEVELARPAPDAVDQTCEVWEADDLLFSVPSDHPDVIAAALNGYNAGKRAGLLLGRAEVQAAFRRLINEAIR